MMSKKRRSYSADFKREAVKLVIVEGRSIAESCLVRGGETVLRRSISQLEHEANGYVLPGCKPLSPEQQRIRELEKRVKELEFDKHTLKKATAILMSNELDDMN
ncbi:transposase [Testudinibacter sp. P27/CKL/0425]